MHLISCANTHRDVNDLIDRGMVKNTKTWIFWERNIIFLQNKNILNLWFRWQILTSYRFVAEVAFKDLLHTFHLKDVNNNRNTFLLMTFLFNQF